MRTTAFTLGMFLLIASPSGAQDPTQVAPEQYKTLFENETVRVLKATYEPGAESAMHSHPDAVAVFVNDGKFSFTLPDGTSAVREAAAEGSIWTPAETHSVKNVGDATATVVLVEMKKSK